MYSSGMKKFILVLALFLCSRAFSDCSKTKIIAVIDTGFQFSFRTDGAKLCQYGHRDFTSIKKFNDKYTKTPVPVDTHGHGTNVGGLIQKHGGNASFCLVILKYYNAQVSDTLNANASLEAINYATQIGADYINYSGGGVESSQQETLAVKKYLDRGGKFIAAAGNNGSNLSYRPYYPAMSDPRVISVGNLNADGTRSFTSNYGSQVTKWEVGENQEGFGITLTGTSQATAVLTGKMVKQDCSK